MIKKIPAPVRRAIAILAIIALITIIPAIVGLEWLNDRVPGQRKRRFADLLSNAYEPVSRFVRAADSIR